VAAYETCVQRIEGKGRVEFAAAGPLTEGCYGEAHAMWDALAAASEIAGADVDDRRSLPEAEARNAQRENCTSEILFTKCAERIVFGMHVCRANVSHSVLDGGAYARDVYQHGQPKLFSEANYDLWLKDLRDERNECIAFVRSVERSIKRRLRDKNLFRYQ
jgi:hypothetical protein